MRLSVTIRNLHFSEESVNSFSIGRKGDRGEGSGLQCHEGDRRPGDEACRDGEEISNPRSLRVGDRAAIFAAAYLLAK